MITLKSVFELLDYKFNIPHYQRGYRWKKMQVIDLLNDILDFYDNPQKQKKDGKDKEKTFYCLQPIVVKQKNNEWEVIDGQQRLTTIFIILGYFNKRLTEGYKNKRFTIKYETRHDSENFLSNINEGKKEENIDYFYIFNASENISKWFKNKQNLINDFESTLLNRVKVIWYEICKEDDTDKKEDPIEIFTRINIGKIPLTNSELIKALFLRKGNFEGDEWDRIRLKQIQIASEWDSIENTLQNDSFWYFIYNGKKEYDTRIEYIFDLIKGNKEDDDYYHTFHKFNDDFKDKNIDKIWLEIKKYFLTFDGWYNDREFYHLIGFLISTGIDISYLKDNTDNKTKTEFKKFLKDEIRKKVDFQIEDLEFSNSKSKKSIKIILLLFNIQTILSNSKSNIRFPFDNFKKENWDIEHIRSVNPDKKLSEDERLRWLNSVIEFFPVKEEKQKKAIVQEEKERDLALEISKLLSNDSISDYDFEKIYEEILEHFGENNDPENIDLISNLTLLDSSTNRSYKNAIFPIKRKTIIENDMNGTFIPICTKNVFLKLYSNKLSGVMFWKWKEDDAEDYLNAIKTTLHEFLPPQNKGGDDE